MDKYKVKVNPRAIHELDHIYEYIANEKLAPENAKGQVDRIKKSILSWTHFHSPIKSVMRADMPEKATVSY